MDIYSLEQMLAQNLAWNRCANQVSGTFSGGVISSADGQSGEDCLCFCRSVPDCFQLQTTAEFGVLIGVVPHFWWKRENEDVKFGNECFNFAG